MNERTTILRQPGSTRWIVFQPDDDKFTKMKLVCGFSGEIFCQWGILNKDVPGMIASWEGDGYKILSTINTNNFKDVRMKKKMKTRMPAKGHKLPKKEDDVTIVAEAIGKAALWKTGSSAVNKVIN